jgi:hypothetical protein
MTAVHLSLKGGIYRVRVLPPDAAPARPVVPETHVGLLSARTAAETAAKLLALPLIDETQKKE